MTNKRQIGSLHAACTQPSAGRRDFIIRMDGRGCRYLSALPVPSLMADCGSSNERSRFVHYWQTRRSFLRLSRLRTTDLTRCSCQTCLHAPWASSCCNVFRPKPNAPRNLRTYSALRVVRTHVSSPSLVCHDTRSDSRVRSLLEYAGNA